MDDAARETGKRIARRSVAWWRTTTPAGRTRAAAVTDLVRRVAVAGQRVEGLPEPHRTPPQPAREDVLVDMLAVVTYDLVRALRERPPTNDAQRVAAATAADCLVTAYEVDPRPIPGALLDAAREAGADPDALARLPRGE